MTAWRLLSSLEVLDSQKFNYRGAPASIYSNASHFPKLILDKNISERWIAKFDGKQWVFYQYKYPVNDIIGLDVEVEVYSKYLGFEWLYTDVLSPAQESVLSSNQWRIYFQGGRLYVGFRDCPLYYEGNLIVPSSWINIRWKWNAFGESSLYINQQEVKSASNIYFNKKSFMAHLMIGLDPASHSVPFQGYIKTIRIHILTQKVRDIMFLWTFCIPPLPKDIISDEEYPCIEEWIKIKEKLEMKVRSLLVEYLSKPEISNEIKKMACEFFSCPRAEDRQKMYEKRIELLVELLYKMKESDPKFCDKLNELVREAKKLLDETPTCEELLKKIKIPSFSLKFFEILTEKLKNICR
ncbi:MAG: hypothetical protein DRO67_09700 [Candidatus Asgardarchaeum californiense]|nr:MAG: hypothetical protein DRO67_09700 [Candidatus Asgardarchaeum californiense]